MFNRAFSLIINHFMSLKKIPKYNRMKIREENLAIDKVWEDEDYLYDEWQHDYINEYIYDKLFPKSGYVGTVDDYHKLKLLTLLRSLHIKSVFEELYDRGW